MRTCQFKATRRHIARAGQVHLDARTPRSVPSNRHLIPKAGGEQGQTLLLIRPLTAPMANVHTLLPYRVQRETLRGQAPYHWRCPTPRRAHPWLSAKPVPKLPRQRQKMHGIHNTKKAPRKDQTKHSSCQSLSHPRVHILNGHVQRSIWPECVCEDPRQKKRKTGQ